MGEAYYFAHDYNAHRDEKILQLRIELGWAAYGMYWAIIEKMYEAGGWLQRDYKRIAFDMQSQSELIQQIVEGFELFEGDKKHFTSPRVQKNLRDRELKSEKARNAAKASWFSRKSDNANAMQTHSKNDANAMLERKGKERKRNEIKESSKLAPSATLADLVAPFKDKYPAPMLNAFVAYWTEKNPNGKKERWQMQKVFDPARRLVTWHSKDQARNQYRKPQGSWKCGAGHEHPTGEQCGHSNIPRRSEPTGIASILTKKV